MARRFILLWLAIPALILAFPRPSWALITHGHPEGLYVHQVAHLLFAGAMIFLIYMMKREGLHQVPGFRTLLWASLFFIWWNIGAFVGHVAEVLLSEQAFAGQPTDFSQRLRMADLTAWVYYLAKMDHLILVPAFYLFYRGLKVLTLKASGGESG